MSSKSDRILIVSASVGAGHTRAAKAIEEEINRQYPCASVEVVDFMDEDNSYLNNMVKEMYLKMLDCFPDMYDFLYRISQYPNSGSKVRNIMARAMKNSMLRLIKKYQPDMVIFTHPFPCGAAAYLKRSGQINLPIIGVITDFGVHRMWIYDEVDLYFVATQPMKDSLVNEGIHNRAIHITGIPVSRKFSYALPVSNLKQHLGLVDMPTLLLMGGGLGIGSMFKVLKMLLGISKPMQIITIAGDNTLLMAELKTLAKESKHLVKVFSFTEYVPELMAMSDILITKPGGLTCSEALAMSLPMIFFHPLPGQEVENATYLVQNGTALWAKSDLELVNEVQCLLNDHEKRMRLMNQTKRLSRPHAASSTVEIIMKEFAAVSVVNKR